MEMMQWIFAASTALFVAFVALLQWRTAQQKAVLDLFDRRHEIFLSVCGAVDLILRDIQRFDQQGEQEFAVAKDLAYFFFGDDVKDYLEDLWKDMLALSATEEQRRRLLNEGASNRCDVLRHRIGQFYTVGQPLFAKYMRFSQTVPRSFERRVVALARQAQVRVDAALKRVA
jgi:hypothetical protein